MNHPSFFDDTMAPPTVRRPPPLTWHAPASFPSLAGRKRIAVDVETCDPELAALGPGVRRGGYIVGLALGFDEGERFYFPVRHAGGGNMDQDMVKRWAREELAKFRGELVGAQLLYDLDYLASDEWGVHFNNVTAFHDVQIAEPLIDENRFQYGLEVLSRDYLGEGKDEELLRTVGAAYGYKTSRELKTNLWRLPAGYAGPYAEGDVDRPLRILPHQLAKIKEEGLEEVYNIERRLIPILLAMRRRGVRVDLQKAEIVRERLKKEHAHWLSVVRSFAGPKAELGSPDSFAHALRERGLSFPVTPKLGKPSITKDWLEKYDKDPLVHAIWEGRKIFTTLNTFIEGHIFTHNIRGRIHCEFNQLKDDDGGTIARFSSSNPNLQNLPSRHPELGPLTRSIFIPEDDSDWQRDDYSQIEYRLLVHFAVGKGAEEARRKYNEDPKTDFHKFVAEMLGVDPEDKIKRKRVKNTNFAKGYGAQPPKLAATFGCSLEEAKAFVAEYDEKLPFAKETFDAASRWAKKRGFVVTILNRRRRFELWEPVGSFGKKRPIAYPRERALREYGPRIVRADTYTALNNKMQGSCADIMKKAMVDGWEAGLCADDALGAYLITVHDELDNSVPRTPRGDEAGKELTRIMQDTVKLKVPVIVESERGANWGECK